MARKAHHSPACLNCGATLLGRFCHICGQENLDHRESVWHLVRHFVEDITHYDGRLWVTARSLLIKPGFLTQEYLEGRRSSYLNPVRMFIFLNFIFFLIWFSLPGGTFKSEQGENSRTKSALSAQDSINIHQLAAEIGHDADSIGTATIGPNTTKGPHTNFTWSRQYRSLHQYDSIQAARPAESRDGYFKRLAEVRSIELRPVIERDPQFFLKEFAEVFKHNIPKMNFFFLIVCSLILALVYVRRRLFMIHHAIFTIHLACTFLLLSLLMLLLSYLPYGLWLSFGVFLYGNYYFYRALRVVYQQGRGKTILKFIVINSLLQMAVSVGLVINLLYVLFSIRG